MRINVNEKPHIIIDFEILKPEHRCQVDSGSDCFYFLLSRSWISAINGKSEKEAKTYLGLLDTSYLFSYAFFMFFSGMLAERMDLRYFLAMGMILSGLFTFMFGLAYAANIHSLAFFISIQVICLSSMENVTLL